MPVITAEIVSLVAIVLVFVLLMKRLSIRGRESGRYNDDEAAIMQKIYKGLTRLEERVEALETLLMDSGELSRKRSPGDRSGDKEGDEAK